MNKEIPPSHHIGSILARLQAFIDDVFEFGFKKLKALGKKKPKIKDPESIKDQAVDIAHKSAEFIGDVGSSYYETYQKIKAEKDKKNDKNKNQ